MGSLAQAGHRSIHTDLTYIDLESTDILKMHSNMRFQRSILNQDVNNSTGHAGNRLSHTDLNYSCLKSSANRENFLPM